MGAGTFFSKVASIDPLAQMLHLPGADKYAQYEASKDMPASTGPYAGVNSSLAGANAGYQAGGPGANPNYVTPTAPSMGGGIFGTLQKIASGAGSTTPSPSSSGYGLPKQPGIF